MHGVLPTNYVNQLSQYGTLVSEANKIKKKRLISPLDFSSLDFYRKYVLYFANSEARKR